MPSVFDKTTAVTPDGEGRYAAELDAGWVVGGGLNGGYLLSVLGNAMRAALPGKPDPLVVSAYFLGASAPGPATVDVEVRRSGGSTSTVAADLRQGDDTRITVLATYGDLDRNAADVRTTAQPFDLPPWHLLTLQHRRLSAAAQRMLALVQQQIGAADRQP